MALAVNPQALTERLLALFNDTNSNSDASISRSRRVPLSDSSITSTEVDPDTFFNRSLFDAEYCEEGLDTMKGMQPVVDNHFPEWTKSMSDLFLRKRENERKAALLKVKEYRDNQPFTGNLFEEQTSRSGSSRDGEIPGERGQKFETIRNPEKCYGDISTACKEEISERSGGKAATTRRIWSTRSSKSGHGLSQSRSQPRPAKQNTRSKTALSQAPNSVLNGRVRKPRLSSSSASAKPKANSPDSPPRRSARIQAMKEKTELSKPATTSPSRGQSKTTRRPQKQQPFRNSRARSKPQGISKPKPRDTRKARNPKGWKGK